MFPLNLPNALTVVRILLVPVVVVALTVESPGGSTIAAIVFAIAALTDGLDGYIARSRQAVTTFGKVMDPVADKLMVAAALISLVSLDRLAAWVAMVIIAREFAVSGLRIAAGQPLGQLLAARAAQVEHPVEELAVDVEHGEQQVRRADGLGLARRGEAARAAGHLVEHVRAHRWCGGPLGLLVRARHQRG